MGLIEILMIRDPDSATDIEVWLDGVKLDDSDPRLNVIDVDAGAGWAADDWQESMRCAVESCQTDGFRTAVATAYADPPGAKYIEGDW